VNRAALTREPLVAMTLLVAALVTPVVAAAAARATAHKLTIYAAPSTVQFMNHADERLRGMAISPFNLKAESVIVSANGKEAANGPFPGDDILYSFKLYAAPKPSKSIGSASFTCFYGFAKQATCDSYFDLAGGLILASGQIAFGRPHFTLAVVGGTRTYFGALGQVVSAPATGNVQRFDLQVAGQKK
jgi:hypothetical protein